MNNENSSGPYGVVCAYACPSVEWHPTYFEPPEPTIQIQGELIICGGTICMGWPDDPCESCMLNKLFSRYYESKIESKTLCKDS